jgi:thiamine pyrophosphate-dependent acetolactate synthase large subunit-like protein
VAEAFGLQSQRLSHHDDIETVLQKALEHQGPSFIEMEVVSQDIIAPFVPKWVQSAKEKNIPNLY